jgi:hypothetical protein
MAEQKTKSTTKKAAAVNTKPKTGTAATGKTKTAAKVPVTTATKKVAVKKTLAAVVETKKAKAPSGKKIATAAAENQVPVKKTTASKAKVPAAGKKVVAKPTPEERYRMVQTAAYFIAEQHGFQGRSDEHWAAAEREIAAKLDK